MSIRVMSRVWDHSQADGSQLLLMLAIADRSDDDGVCWPGIAYLAKKTRVSERQVKRMIKTAESAGEIYVRRSGGRARTNLYFVTAGLPAKAITEILVNHYLLRMDRPQAVQVSGTLIALQKGDTGVTLKKGDTSVTLKPPKGDTQGLKVTPRAAKGDTQGQKGDIAMSPDSSIDPSLKHPSYDSREREQALAIFHQATGRRPLPDQTDLVVSTILEHKLTPEELADYWTEWHIVRAHRAQNLSWLTEWAVLGRIPGRKVPRAQDPPQQWVPDDYTPPDLPARRKPPPQHPSVGWKVSPESSFTAALAWEFALGELQREMPKGAFDSYVAPIWLYEFTPDACAFRVVAGNPYACDWLEARIKTTVETILTGLCNSNRQAQVEFIPADQIPPQEPAE